MGEPRREGADAGPLTVLIVDDEQPARRKLRRMLDAAPGIAKVFEAPNGRLALDVIEAEEPDVIFLDVRMPGIDGFQLVDALGPDRDTHVVFVTAYDEHAVRAFEVRAVDYLLKPFDERRFREALDRVREAVAARRASAERRTVGEVLSAFRDAAAGGSSDRLLVEGGGGRRVLLSLDRVVRIETDRNRAVFHTGTATFTLRTTLGDLEARLDARRFARINRGEIVNLDRVAEIELIDHGDARVHLSGGEVRRLTRRYRSRFERFR